jgi:hypothetical protein
MSAIEYEGITRLGRTSIAPLADSRHLTLRLAVEGSAARPVELINHQRVCLIVW